MQAVVVRTVVVVFVVVVVAVFFFFLMVEEGRERRGLLGAERAAAGVELSLHRAEQPPGMSSSKGRNRRNRHPECPKDLASALMAGYKRVDGSREEQLARSIASKTSSSLGDLDDDDNSSSDLSSVYSWDPPAATAACTAEEEEEEEGSSSTSSSSSSSSSWFDSQDWGSLYPRCTQADEWCDARYPRGETDAVQRALHAHQNPVDCDRARLLVLSEEYSSGLGSSLHIHAYMLSLAISDNRVLVVDPGARWE